MADTKNMDMIKLVEKFGGEDKCREYLEDLRWSDGMDCPRCGGVVISRIKKRNQFDCDDCRYQFSVRSGTILHDSHLPLWKWFLAVYMMVESKKGISANQLKRMLKVSYKTAWYLCHRIRAAMKDEAPEQLRGVVEVDETWIGPKNRGGGRGNYGKKTMVMGAVTRGGKVRMTAMPDAPRNRDTVTGFIEDAVHDDAAEIITDEFPGYRGLEDHNTRHRTVNHSKTWVTGENVHTNTIEGVWALMKRSIHGSYHKLSVKHLPAYLDEMAFRYNNRENEFMFRDTWLRLLESDNVTYRELVA